MLLYEIPGRGIIKIKNIVFDYNGTIAVGGNLIDGVRELINKLAQDVNIYILTSDTYGNVKKECSNVKAEILTFPKDNAGYSKKKIVEKIGGNSTLCVGNGYNDIPMFKESILSIAIIGSEGTSGKLISEADIVAKSIIQGINIITNANMVKATLRS